MLYSASAWKTFFVEWAQSIVRNNESPLAARLRKRLYRTRCRLDSGVVITAPDHFSCGTNCALYHGTYLLNGHGSVQMGNNSHFGAMCYVNALHGSLTVGSDVAIGPHTDIIVYSNHYERGKPVTDCRVQKDVSIGDNVFIGAHTVILPGTTIEDNVVVGAGSVVKGYLDPNSIYAGAPCRKIREGWYD